LQKTEHRISWVILAGGKASRMGGNDKGLIPLNGTPLIQYVHNTLSAQIQPIYINANRNLDAYSQYGQVLSDERNGYQGPLAGIEASLQQLDSDWIGFCPCDCPNLSTQLVERLTTSLDPETEIYVAKTGEKLQPVFSVWNKSALPKLTRFLENGDRKFILFLQQCNTTTVDFSDQPDSFINLNSPQDMTNFGANNDN
jgi:molybdopterin-guanine dinucleotide biosynthesis protein A